MCVISKEDDFVPISNASAFLKYWVSIHYGLFPVYVYLLLPIILICTFCTCMSKWIHRLINIVYCTCLLSIIFINVISHTWYEHEHTRYYGDLIICDFLLLNDGTHHVEMHAQHLQQWVKNYFNCESQFVAFLFLV